MVAILFSCSIPTFSSSLDRPQQIGNTTISSFHLQNMSSPSPRPWLAGHPACNGDHYGYQVDQRSCQNAWQKIDRNPVLRSYRVRSTSKQRRSDYLSPVRYLSNDGRCAIDISLKQGATQDLSSDLTISIGAGSVLDSCVNLLGIGGMLADFCEFVIHMEYADWQRSLTEIYLSGFSRCAL